MFEPVGPQSGNADRLETECGWGAGFELFVDPGGELPGGVAVGTDARTPALAVFEVTEVPDAAAEVAGHLADAERVGAGHAILGDPSRHKTPQNRHKREALRDTQKGKGPWGKHLCHTGRQDSGEGGIRTLERVSPLTVFETGPINHSGTSPKA